MSTNRTQVAVAELLAVALRPWDISRDPGPMGIHDRLDRIYEAAKRVRQAQADDEYASWLEVPRCDAS